MSGGDIYWNNHHLNSPNRNSSKGKFFNWWIQKRYYNRETITTLNYKIHKMSYIPPFYATQIINPFLNLRISAYHDKVERLSVNDEILIKGIVSLL